MRSEKLWLIVLVLCMGGCRNTSPPTNPTPPPKNPFASLYTRITPIQVKAAPISEETQRACNQFASELLQKLDKPGENLLFSPIALTLNLAMMLNGASGNTRASIARALGVEKVDEKVFNQQMYSLLQKLRQSSGVTLYTVNGVWVDQQIKPKTDFLRTLVSYYEVQLWGTDFRNSGLAARQINDWVAYQTRSTIRELFQPNDFADEVMAAVLVNALFFDGTWETPFPAENTRPGKFFLENGESREVPMMRSEGGALYMMTEDFQAVGLSYRSMGERFTFYLFLPYEHRTVGWMREQWTAENWAKWRQQFHKSPGTIVMPRFQIEQHHDANLQDALKAMGLEVAFDPHLADFSRLADIPDIPEYREYRIRIAKVVQKAAINLNEYGTRVVVATGDSSGAAAASVPFHLVVNRPFLFAIVHEETGIVLVMGIIRDPAP
ncbi:hypothetical protein HRbin14_00441 [bacterium HR14]|nr:hypothetical protein HRbin14_00441 [bacterium HR14]